MIARLRARPQAYVAQELVNFSRGAGVARTSQARRSAATRRRPARLRRRHPGWPRGHARRADARRRGMSNARIISMQRGGSSKDTWVLTDAAVNTFSLLKHSVGKADIVRGGRNLSSRVVESLCTGSAATRNAVTRLRACCASRCRAWSMPAPTRCRRWAQPSRPLPRVPCNCCRTPRPSTHAAAKVQDESRRRTAPECADAARRLQQGVGRGSRRRHPPPAVGGDTGARALLARQLACDQSPAAATAAVQRDTGRRRRCNRNSARRSPFSIEVLLTASSLAGFAMDNMTRDDGWRFLIIGRRIERLVFLANAVAGFLRLDIDASCRQPRVVA
jgi:hypothetical protein